MAKKLDKANANRLEKPKDITDELDISDDDLFGDPKETDDPELKRIKEAAEQSNENDFNPRNFQT